MATTKLNNGQLPTTLSSKTIDNTNDISTTTTKLKISGGTNGQVLSTDGSGNLSWTTAGGGLGAPVAVVTKTADESVTSSTTLQDDDELFYALTGGKTYWIELRLIASRINTTNSNLVFVALDGNSDGYWYAHPAVGNTNLVNGTTRVQVQASGSTNAGVRVPGVAHASIATSGNYTFKVRWAQSNNNTTTVTVHKGSQLLIWEVA